MRVTTRVENFSLKLKFLMHTTWWWVACVWAVLPPWRGLVVLMGPAPPHPQHWVPDPPPPPPPVPELSTKQPIFLWLMLLISSIQSPRREIRFLISTCECCVRWGSPGPQRSQDCPETGTFAVSCLCDSHQSYLLNSGTEKESILFKTVVLFML